MAKELAIVLNNGTVNSAVVTALAAQKFRPVMLHAEMSQESRARAHAAYDQQVAHFKPYREHTLPMPFFAGIGSTHAQQAAANDPRQTPPLGPLMIELLPLIATAIRFAAHYHAPAIFLGLRIGTVGDDLAQSTEYVQIWNEMIQIPCAIPDVEVQTPLLELEEWQVIDLGFQVAAPFERTWSCLEESGEPCWACRGCRARESAFQQAAKPDPLRAVLRNAR
jgi:7-cyano-7-deazaguanine synthase in queuosine biosynthesis